MSQSAQQQEHQTELPVGEILRRTRMHYGRSVEEVEQALRIRADQIEAIEQGHVEKIPARVYAIGFVRTYSEFLGLDGDKMVALFKQQSAGQANDPVLDFPVTASDSKIPPLWLLLVCIVAIIVISSLWWGTRDADRNIVDDVPNVPAALKPETLQRQQETPITTPPASQEETAAAQTPPSNTQEPAAQTAQKPVPQKPVQKGIILKMQQNSWVEIKDKTGKTVLSRVLKQGDQYFVPDHAELTMSLGNAGGVAIQVDGQPLQQLGENGQVVRNIPLSGNSLKERFGLREPETTPALVPGTVGKKNTLENSAQ